MRVQRRVRVTASREALDVAITELSESGGFLQKRSVSRDAIASFATEVAIYNGFLQKPPALTRSRARRHRALDESPAHYTVCPKCQSKRRVKVTLSDLEMSIRDGIQIHYPYSCFCPKGGFELVGLEDIVTTTEEKWARISQRKGWR